MLKPRSMVGLALPLAKQGAMTEARNHERRPVALPGNLKTPRSRQDVAVSNLSTLGCKVEGYLLELGHRRDGGAATAGTSASDSHGRVVLGTVRRPSVREPASSGRPR